MVYSTPFLRVSWLFNVHNTDEIAVTDLNFTAASPAYTSSTLAALLADAADWQDAIFDLMSGSYLAWANYSNVIGVKGAMIGTNGLYLVDPVQADFGEGSVGTAGSIPAQDTVALSLRAAGSLGKGNIGRMYLPHCRNQMDANSPYASASSQSALGSAAAGFISRVNDLATDAFTAGAGSANAAQAVVLSQTSTPTAKPITRVLTGRVTDTQRRRRNRLQEQYVENAVT